MEIIGKGLGKKYGRHWIFRNIDVSIAENFHTVITGSNGAGKSTLLKILSGYLTPSEGTVTHDSEQAGNDKYRKLSYTAPYIELPEEMTLDEFLTFQSTYRVKSNSNQEIAKRASLPLNKRIQEFSTGMKQRAQLCTAFYFENEALFMDEPTSNLDKEGFEWWKGEIETMSDTSLILASNIEAEIAVCPTVVSL